MANNPIEIDFRNPANLAELAKYIGIEARLLEKAIQPDKAERADPIYVQANDLLESTADEQEIKIELLRLQLYYKHLIPKRNSRGRVKYRVAWEATSRGLADAYKSFARRFELFARLVEKRYPHPSSYGYVRGRSTIENAQGHCVAKEILHADIKNFFPSISVARIKKLFSDLGVKETTADILARFVTIEEKLPLGLHPSPLLANLVCLDLDDKLDGLARKYGCFYTRYADDITISGNSGVPSREELETILKGEGFNLSERKFRVTKPGQAHYVTGLSVTDSKPRAPRTMKRRLRQELYYCEKYGVEDHLERIDGSSDDFLRRGINRIDGTVRYVAHIEQDSLPGIREEWKGYLHRDVLETNYKTNPEDIIRQFVFYVDETVIAYQDKKYLALALVQTDDPDQITASTINVLHEHLVDPFAGGRKEALEKKKLHYTDANEDLRAAYINKIATFPFRGYVVYRQLLSDDQYEGCYLSLIEKILPHRLMGCDNDVALFIFEENSQVRSAKIEKTVMDIYEGMKKANSRCPYKIKVIAGKKVDHAPFSVADFLLGVFSRYARLNGEAPERRERGTLFFERLRDKYRVILNADTGLVYTRKRAFLPWT